MEALQEVFVYASHVDEWLVIKKEMLKILPAPERKHFSTRHPITKRQMTNDFERELAKKWQEMTQRPVIFSDDETHK